MDSGLHSSVREAGVFRRTANAVTPTKTLPFLYEQVALWVLEPFWNQCGTEKLLAFAWYGVRLGAVG
jgi:hypothetical protein